LTNLQEFQRGTNPHSADTDADGLTDGQEVLLGTNPLLADTDGDGLTDGQEVLRGSNPLSTDTDGDGIADGLEIQLGLNLTNANPVTTVEGRVVDTSNAPVVGAAVTLFNLLTANSDANGFFSIPNVPAGLGPLIVVAQTVRLGQILDGTSPAINPVAGGITSVGTIQIGLNAGTVAGVITDPFGAPVPGAFGIPSWWFGICARLRRTRWVGIASATRTAGNDCDGAGLPHRFARARAKRVAA
jgi:hypothetical protein